MTRSAETTLKVQGPGNQGLGYAPNSTFSAGYIIIFKAFGI